MENEHIITVMVVSASTWAVAATIATFLGGKTHLRYTMPYAGVSIIVLAATLSLAALEAPGRNAAVYLLRSLVTGDVRHVVAAAMGMTLSYGLATGLWRFGGLRATGFTAPKVVIAAGLVSCLLSYLLGSLFVLGDRIRPFVSNPISNRTVTGPRR